MEKYRSILLADCIGKLGARGFRGANLEHIAEELCSPLAVQCGGVPGFGTDFPTLAARLFQDRAKKLGQSTAIIFVDAKQAFYAIIRSLVVPVCESDEAVAFMFSQLKIPPSSMDALRATLRKGPTITETKVAPAASRDIASTLSACHFTVRGSSLLGSANKGTRPGHPYADIIFAFCFSENSRIFFCQSSASATGPPQC